MIVGMLSRLQRIAMAVGLLSAAVTAQTSPFDATIATVRSSDGFKKAMASIAITIDWWQRSSR